MIFSLSLGMQRKSSMRIWQLYWTLHCLHPLWLVVTSKTTSKLIVGYAMRSICQLVSEFTMCLYYPHPFYSHHGSWILTTVLSSLILQMTNSVLTAGVWRTTRARTPAAAAPSTPCAWGTGCAPSPRPGSKSEPTEVKPCLVHKILGFGLL